jgi:hypothetical protein
VVRDPLVADARDLAEQSVTLTAIAQTTVDGAFDQVRLAPDGRSFLLSEEPDEHDEPAPRRHVIGTFDGWTRTIEADDSVLAGQDRVLLLDRNNGHTQLRTERLRSTAGPAWTLNVPGVEAFSLAAMPDGRWQLMNRERNAFMRIDGRVGTKATSRIKWDVEAGSAEYVSLHGVGAGHVGLGLAVQWSEPSLPSWLPGLEWHRQTTLLRVEGGETNRLATSRLNVACADPAITVATYLCVAFDGRVSRFWRYHPDSARLEPVGRARGWFFLDSQETSTTLTGMREGSVVFADFDAARITAFRLLNSPGFVAHDFSEDFLIASITVGDQTSVALYRLSDAPTPSAGQVHVRR